MSAETYSKNSTARLTPNFKISEFHCKGSTCGCTQTLHDPQLSAYLQQIREHFGKPVYITSGYRCPTHNKAIGGSETSQHTLGQAADFYIKGLDAEQIAIHCERIGILGVGCYDKNHGNYVHIDTRAHKYFWKNQSSNAVSTFDPCRVSTAKLYAVTYRTDNSDPLTVLFDHSVGAYRQHGITMTPGEENTTFSADANVQIMNITTL